MDAGLEIKVIECLDALESGQSIEQILARYPEDAAVLRPMLETASQISQVRVAHSLEAQAKSRERFVAQGAALAAGASRPKAAFFGLRRLALSTISLFLMLVVVGVGIVFAASETVPGDALYGAKRTIENVRLSLTSGASGRDSLAEEFERERLREIGILLEQGRSAGVTFAGVVETIDGNTWHVAGVTVMVDESTQIERLPEVGWTVEVRGTTEEGHVLATEITILESKRDEPTPEPEPTQVDETDIDPTSTPTPSPSNTPEPTPAATPSATSTPAAGAPTVPQPAPTADDDSDDDDDDTGDDNGTDDDSGDDGQTDDGPDDGGSDDDRDGQDGGGDQSGDDDGDDPDDDDDGGSDDDGGDDGGESDDDSSDNDGG